MEQQTYSRRQFLVYDMVMAEMPSDTAEGVVMAGYQHDGDLLDERLTWAQWLAERESDADSEEPA